MAGWGLKVFTYGNGDWTVWWLVPIFATHLGAILGAWLYHLCIGNIGTLMKYADQDIAAEIPGIKDDAVDTIEVKTDMEQEMSIKNV